MRLILLFFTLFTLQSCFVYDNQIALENIHNIKKYDHRDGDTSMFKFTLTIEKETRFIYLPFVFMEVSKRKPIYSPEISMTSMDKSIIEFKDLHLELKTLNDLLIFSRSFPETIYLNKFENYNANLYRYKGVLIPELNKNDSIIVNYKLKAIDRNGSISSISRSDKLYVTTKYKWFGSFF